MRVELEAVDVHHRLGRVHAVRSASLVVEPGVALGVVGPNGAGKSSLLSCVMAFTRPRRGAVRVDGMPPDALPVRAREGWLAEKPAFPPGMTARGVVEWNLELLGRSRGDARREAAESLERVGMRDAADRRPSRFSLGMRQRLGLACAVLGDPALLVLDEPATGLDPPGVAVLRAELLRARDRGATILLSSHQLEEIERTCSHVAFMREGRVGEPREIASLAQGVRVLRLRLASRPERFREIAAECGRVLDGGDEGVLRVEVASDEMADALVRRLAAAGARIAEAAPEQARLERLFTEAP